MGTTLRIVGAWGIELQIILQVARRTKQVIILALFYLTILVSLWCVTTIANDVNVCFLECGWLVTCGSTCVIMSMNVIKVGGGGGGGGCHKNDQTSFTLARYVMLLSSRIGLGEFHPARWSAGNPSHTYCSSGNPGSSSSK